MPALVAPISNRLLNNLPPVEYQQILISCEKVELVCGEALCDPNEPYHFVYFPLTGFISLMASVEKHQTLGMNLIGNEGLLGVTLILDVDAVAIHGMVQGSGSALRIDRSRFQQLLNTSPTLSRRLKYYLFIVVAQLAQSATCNHFHNIEPRLARWLLMSHDRAHSNRLYITHEFLSSILGVRRSSISIAASELRRKGLINYARGEINIVNRSGLEATSCKCYAAMHEVYTRLLGSV
ncbi:MAG: CRP-like cAMP-binding protein [Candidatus Endobugula sp.]|jgi:CRP-like cAMP-binding protein